MNLIRKEIRNEKKERLSAFACRNASALFLPENGARASGTNQAVVLITADTVPGTGDAIYIRLRNTDPKQGWGGAVLRFEFQCLKEKK